MLDTLCDKTGEQLVRSVVFCDFNYHAMKGKETDDLIGEGFLGLTRALNQYDKNKGEDFIAFACVKTKHAVIEYLRLERTKDALKTFEIKSSDLLYIPDIEAVVERLDFVAQLINCLTRQEKKIIHRTYWQDESERDIARDLAVSKTHVHLAKTYAIQKMRDRGNFLMKKGGKN